MMKPSEIAQALRKVADKIDASKLPHANAVAEELQSVIGSMPKTGADPVSADIFMKCRAIFKGLKWESSGGDGYEYDGKLKLGFPLMPPIELNVTMVSDGEGNVEHVAVKERRKEQTVEYATSAAMSSMMVDKNWL